MKSAVMTSVSHVGFPFYSLEATGEISFGIPCKKQRNQTLLVKAGGKRDHQVKILSTETDIALRSENGTFYIDSGYIQEFEEPILKIRKAANVSQDQAFLYLPVTRASRIRTEDHKDSAAPYFTIARSFVVLKPGSKFIAAISHTHYEITCSLGKDSKIHISAIKVA